MLLAGGNPWRQTRRERRTHGWTLRTNRLAVGQMRIAVGTRSSPWFGVPDNMPCWQRLGCLLLGNLSTEADR